MSEEDQGGGGPRGKPFGPGHRGKPGRARGTKNLETIVRTFAEETHRVIEDGKRETYSSAELLIKALLVKSMEGDVTASRYLDGLRQRFAPPVENVGFLLSFGGIPEDKMDRYVEWYNSRVVQPDPPEGLY